MSVDRVVMCPNRRTEIKLTESPAIVQAFSAMSDDLTKEKKVILKQWAKQ